MSLQKSFIPLLFVGLCFSSAAFSVCESGKALQKSEDQLALGPSHSILLDHDSFVKCGYGFPIEGYPLIYVCSAGTEKERSYCVSFVGNVLGGKEDLQNLSAFTLMLNEKGDLLEILDNTVSRGQDGGKTDRTDLRYRALFGNPAQNISRSFQKNLLEARKKAGTQIPPELEKREAQLLDFRTRAMAGKTLVLGMYALPASRLMEGAGSPLNPKIRPIPEDGKKLLIATLNDPARLATAMNRDLYDAGGLDCVGKRKFNSVEYQGASSATIGTVKWGKENSTSDFDTMANPRQQHRAPLVGAGETVRMAAALIESARNALGCGVRFKDPFVVKEGAPIQKEPESEEKKKSRYELNKW